MKLIRKHMSGQKGFTLIELLVVVAILGILATIAVPRVMDAIDNARARKAESDLTVIRDGLERFYLDYGIFPPSLGWLSKNAFIDPNFTFKNSYGFKYFYAVRWDGKTAPTTLTDYVLADPGRLPSLFQVPGSGGGILRPLDDTSGNFPKGRVCEGQNQSSFHAFYWYDDAVVAPPAADLDLDAIDPVMTWTGAVSGKVFTLAGDEQATPPATNSVDLFALTYVNDADVVGTIVQDPHKPPSPPILYFGKQ